MIETDTIRKACNHYMRSPSFRALSGRSQIDYENNLKRACNTKVQKGKYLGNLKLKEVRFKHMTMAYDYWLDNHGVRQANYILTNISTVFNAALRLEAMLSNPASLVKRHKSKPRKIKWERKHVTTFLNHAYSTFKWRSIGLIVHMAYEWSQRVGDMRMLRWDCLDLDAQRLDLEQSKRRADVHIPISDNLCRMLRQQQEDFGFQSYVAPRIEPRAGAYTPYDPEEIHRLVNAVKAAADLPQELTAMDLRRTGITEMLEAGVDTLGIMQVSGHSNPQSVKPYLVNTFKGASAAQAKRNIDYDDI